jgi:signal transduction histidine kinase
MLNVRIRELISELLESFALVGVTPIAIYEKDGDGKITLVAHANHSHFPRHCQELWQINDGKTRCHQDMIERAGEGFTSGRPGTSLCHAGLTTEIYPINVDGETVAVLQFGAFLEPDVDDGEQRLERHHRLMNELGANPAVASHIKELLFDHGLRRTDSDRDWIRRALPLTIERVIYRHLEDLSQELRVRKQEDTVKTSAYHDVQLRLQAALAQAEDHLYELKDPTAKTWYLHESAEQVVNSIEMAGTVLHNLMQGGYLPEDYRFEQLDLREIILDAISLAHPVALQKRININHEIKPERMRIMIQASGIHLQQAFNNLVHNAVKYSYRANQYGGRHVTIRGQYAEHGYKVTITNYGVGILNEEYERIFEPGYKGKLREREYRTGSGQGLPLTKQIIDRHNGKICLNSQPMGDSENNKKCPYLTEFKVWLPLTQPTKSTSAGKPKERVDNG